MYTYITVFLSFISCTALAQERIEYPYSLIPGGVTSDADFEQHRDEAKLSDHYADVGFLRPQYLQTDGRMWASYSRHGLIFWTPVMIHKGELVLRDRYGNTIRGRCGNRLSDTPRQPVEFVPPVRRELENLLITYSVPPSIPAPTEAVDFPSIDLPPREEGPAVTEPPFIPGPITPGVPSIPIAGEGPVSVPLAPTVGRSPESGTSWLILAGLFIVGLRQRQVRSTNRH